MKICVVEDEEVWRNKIEEIIKKYCLDKNILFQIDNTFVNSNSELQYILYLINHDNLYIELDANLNAIENVISN